MGGAAYIGEEGKIIKYKEFDNFCTKYEFMFNGMAFNSSEQFFQFHKCDDEKFRKDMLTIGRDPGLAWDLGNKCNLREDWEASKVHIMCAGNYFKILTNKIVSDILVKTEGPIIFKRSCDFWNKENARILSTIRQFLLNDFY